MPVYETYGCLMWSHEETVSVVPNRRDKRAQMAKGKPSKGTKKDKRLKRNRRRR